MKNKLTFKFVSQVNKSSSLKEGIQFDSVNIDIQSTLYVINNHVLIVVQRHIL